jgi:DNA ligase-1
MINTYPTLYHRDSKGRVRQWHMENEEAKYRSVAGLVDGEKVTSEWVVALPKNVNKANGTTGLDQARTEIGSKYRDKLKKKYFESIEEIDDFTFHKPMLAHDYTKRFTKKNKTLDFPVLAQPKLDGIRCIISKHGSWSRNGTELVTVPHILKALEPVFAAWPEIVLDGELYNHEYKANFEDLASLIRKTKPTAEDLDASAKAIQYHVYDCMNGNAFWVRCRDVTSAVRLADDPMVVQVYCDECDNQERLDAVMARYIEDGYEGQMIRFHDSPYKNSRSTDLLKRKEFMDQEFEIVDILPGLGNWSGVAKTLVIKLPNGETCRSGMRGSMKRALYILDNKDKFIGKQATVRFQEWTKYGVPRFPVAVALHEEERL